jgi:quinol monooxygenase YgiN
MDEVGTWGLLGRLRAVPGKRDELISRLRDSSRDVPGKLLYLIQLEIDDPDAFWINEIWRDQAAYDACLATPQAKEGVALIAPLIASNEHRTETRPLAD